MLDEILLQLSVSAGRGTLETGLPLGTRRLQGHGWALWGCPRRVLEPTSSLPCVLQVSVPVDVMPGEFDPTNYTLPQQPLHPCMFPLATAYSTLQLVTNPYQATIDGVR